MGAEARVIEMDDAARPSRLREVLPGGSLGTARGDCVVCIPVYGGYRLFTECLHSVLRHTPGDALLVVADDASPDEDALRLLRELDLNGVLGREVVYLRQPHNLGFVGNMNSVMEMAAPADVVVLNSDCVVPAGWLECLREAAYSDSTIATASALSNNGTVLSVPYRNRPLPHLPQDWTLDQAALAVRQASPRLRPRIPTAIGHCMYIRRSALELVGNFDPVFAPGYGEEVDFSQRCISRGLSHVAADDLLVWHYGRGSFGTRPEVANLQQQHERIIESRYPQYAGEVTAITTDMHGPLARSLGAARRALLGMSVTIDASCLTRATSVQGTQLLALELTRALCSQDGIRLRVVVPRHCGRQVTSFLRDLTGVETLFVDEVGPETELSDVVHRPFQVSYVHELLMLRRLGERLVITHQDMIAYRNPGYYRTFAEWDEYSKAVRASLAIADAVVFISEHAANDAVGEGLTERRRAWVVNNGTDRHFGLELSPRLPRGARALVDTAFLLCLGADFHHKNRVFALRVLEQLQQRHSWPGRMVLAGPKVSCGSSSSEEAEFFMRHPDVDRATLRLPAVTEEERLWLMEHAAAVLYPTVYEGFGLIPFEAAAANVPPIFAPQASLAELLPAETALIVPWDEAATADRTMEILRDEGARRRLITAVQTAGRDYRWSGAAERLLRVYDEALQGPPNWRITPDIIDPTVTVLGRHLVGDEGVLSEDVQHILWAIGRRRSLARPFFAALTGLHGLGRAAIRARATFRSKARR
jgi:GT2 family glycosyltransferase/glycosyltransferase involved in cell wall biosynthesis